VALACLPLDGHCGAPFETDDPSTVAKGHVELLAFYQSTLQASGRTGTFLGLESHFGAFDGVEFDIITPLAFNIPAGQNIQHGYGDTTFGLKYQLLEESDELPLVSLVPKIVLPTGNSSRGLGNGGSQAFLALAALKTLGSLQTYANAGYWINNGTDNRNYWFVGAQGQYQLSDAWILGAEIFHNTVQSSGQSPSTGFNVGGYYVLGPYGQVLFSAGHGLQNANQTNRVSTYLGFQLSF
jgi:hypothetical protein